NNVAFTVKCIKFEWKCKSATADACCCHQWGRINDAAANRRQVRFVQRSGRFLSTVDV
ncbi:unnamed protein product, partial [Tenebrio molitor]